MSQADLEISLFPRHAESYSLALRFRHASSGQDNSVTGSFVLDADELRQRQHDPAAYGEELAAQLFASPGVRGFLDQALAVAASQQTPLHLRLFISADAQELHSLRWETLRLPGSAAPLAAGEWLRFSRYLDGKDWRTARTAERDALQALIAIASPDVRGTTLAEVRTEEELAAARAGLGAIPTAELATRGQVTLANLLARLRDGCDILYLVAHGELVDGEPQILLEREDGGRTWTSGRELAARIGELAQPPSLVLLVSCQSAGSGDAEPSTHDGGALAGLGPRLAAAGVPAVVAMQGNFTMPTAAAFIPTFLRELRRDGQVDRAMAVARGAVRERPDWWMPVLFMRLEDGRVFDLTAMLPPPPCPYPGMVSFRAEDSRFFYGREDEIQQMMDHLRHQRLLMVIGPSGSGKSSLIAAGLLPRLEKSTYFAPGFWRVRTMRPLDNPVAALAACLEGDISQPEQAVAALLAANAPAQRLLLVIDQFEEAFSLADKAERQQFMAALQVLRRSQQCTLVIALRADFYPDLMNSEMWPVDPGQRLEVAGLRGGALRQAIRQPATDVEVEIDEALIERLLADAAGEPGALPMLQETLVLLWERMRRRQITLGDYERLGEGERSGLAVAVARKADATVAELTPAEQLIAQRIFLRLIQFGEGRRDTRRQLPAADLRSAADDDQAFGRTLEHLARNRLLTTSSEEGGARRVDIAHEALIAGWPRLQDWLNQRRAAEQTRRRLEVKATEWVATQKRGGLLDEYELQEAEHWLAGEDAQELGYSQDMVDLAATSRAKLEQDKAEKETQRQRELDQVNRLAKEQRLRAEEGERAARRLRHRLTMAGVFGGIAVLLGVIAVWFAVQSRNNEERAQTEARRARSGELAVEAVQVTRDGTDPSLALMLGEEAVKLTLDHGERPPQQAVDALQQAVDAAPILQAIAPRDRHEGAIYAVAWSPDATIIATAGADETVRLWNAVDGRQLMVLDGHTDSVLSVDFNQEGTLLASAGFDGTARVWDVGTGGLLATLEHPTRLWRAAFSADGVELATAGDDGLVRVWTWQNENDGPALLSGHSQRVFSVDYSADGAKLVSASGDGRIGIWNAKTKEQIHLLRAHQDAVMSASWSPEGQTVLTASLDGSALSWNLAGDTAVPTLLAESATGYMRFAEYNHNSTEAVTIEYDGKTCLRTSLSGELVNCLGGPNESTTMAAFSPDDTKVVAVGESGSIRIWDVETGNQVPFWPGHTSGVRILEFSKDGSHLASSDEDGALIVWDAGDLSLKRRLPLHPDALVAIEFNPTNPNELMTLGKDGALQLWNLSNGAPVWSIVSPVTSTLSATFSADGAGLFTIERGGAIQVIDVKQGKVTGHLANLDGIDADAVVDVTFSHSGAAIATGDSEGRVCVWLAQNEFQKECRNLHPSAITALAFAPDGSLLLSGSADGTIYSQDIPFRTDPILIQDDASPSVDAIRVSSDGRFAVTGSTVDDNEGTGLATVINLDTRQPQRTLPGHFGHVRIVAISPDGTEIATAGDDLAIRLWRNLSTRDMNQWQAHEASVYSMALAGDAGVLASVGDDGKVRLWQSETGQLIHEIDAQDARFLRVAIDSEGHALVAGDDMGRATVFAVENEIKIKHTLQHESPVTAVALNSEAEQVITGTSDGDVVVWDVSSGKLLHQWKGHDARVTSVALSSDGQYVASTSFDGLVKLWNISTDREIDLTSSIFAGFGHAVTFSLDGRFLAASGDDEFRNCVRLWRIEGGDSPLTLECYSNLTAATGIAFDPDGKSLVVAFANAPQGKVTVWDPQSNQVLRTLSHDLAGFTALATSPAAGTILVGDQTGVIHRWSSIQGLIEVADELNQRRPIRFYARERSRYNVGATAQ